MTRIATRLPGMRVALRTFLMCKRALRPGVGVVFGALAFPGIAAAAADLTVAESLWALLLEVARAELERNTPWLLGGLGALVILMLWIGLARRRRRRRMRVPARESTTESEHAGIPEPAPVPEAVPEPASIAEPAPISPPPLPEPVPAPEPAPEPERVIPAPAPIPEPIPAPIPEPARAAPARNRSNGGNGYGGATSHDALRAAEVSAQKGAAAVHNTITGLDNAAKQLRTTAERLHQLEDSAQRITALGEQLLEVGEQADILALNAAVQAARSGESGRGMALAAEDAQRLAANSARVIGEIADLARRMKRDAEQALAETEATAGDATGGAALAIDAARALGEIESASRDFLEMHALRR
ncbi:MAG: methyl-accepting chemotaxis protein [Gammaproteobacteria bacterium]|nr:methyl-accepting chemotaxis protein [Gammaproteobacteria bacterium]